MRKYTHLIDTTFDISVTVKGIDGLLEYVGGIILLLIKPATINKVIINLTQHELAQDPKDIIANHLLRITNHTHSSQLFGAIYLLTHGVIKIILAWALLKKYFWAYPTSIVVLGIFSIYQIYRITYTHSIGLILLTIFDLFVIWLIWQEYKLHTKDLHHKPA